jgi:hypothetical protein
LEFRWGHRGYIVALVGGRAEDRGEAEIGRQLGVMVVVLVVVLLIVLGLPFILG